MPTQERENITRHLHDNSIRLLPPPSVNGDSAKDTEQRWNPLAVDPIASRFSSYAAFSGKEIITPFAPDRPVDANLTDAHDQLRQQILGHFYPCTGAISTFTPKSYRFGLYPELASEDAVRAVCHDLYCFSHEFPVINDHFLTFIAMFHGPVLQFEQDFEDLLWKQLPAMHLCDSNFFAWDEKVDSDPQSHRFSFSIGGRAMFVVGPSPHVSREPVRAQP